MNQLREFTIGKPVYKPYGLSNIENIFPLQYLSKYPNVILESNSSIYEEDVNLLIGELVLLSGEALTPVCGLEPRHPLDPSMMINSKFLVLIGNPFRYFRNGFSTASNKETTYVMVSTNIEGKELLDLFATDKYRKLSESFGKCIENVKSDVIMDKGIKYLRYGRRKAKEGSYVSTQWTKIPSLAIDELKTAFYPYLDIDKLVEEYMKSKSGLLILNGNPGLGKSKLMTIIVDRINKEKRKQGFTDDDFTIRSISSHSVAMEDAWCEVTDSVSENDIIFVDDVLPDLLQRGDNMIYESLLQILDSVTNNNVKVIITTNAETEFINERIRNEEPLFRNGRFFDIITLKALKASYVEKFSDVLGISGFSTFEEYVKAADIGEFMATHKKSLADRRSSAGYLKKGY